MKHFGCKFEYGEERDRDLMRAYRETISSCDVITLSQVFSQVVNMPSKRFWVSEERAAIVIARMTRGDMLVNMRPCKREMFHEIFRRANLYKEKNADATLYDIAFAVVRQRAPKFYLTPDSAKVIISRIKRRWYEERKKKLRHTF